jgi:hypothetical protein
MKISPPRYRNPLTRALPDRPDAEELKRVGWRDQQILVVSPADDRLDWVERELLTRIGNRLYGNATGNGGRHG